MNNRTKEARPEDFVQNAERYYMAKAQNRGALNKHPQMKILLW